VAELLQDVALRFRIRAQEGGVDLHTLLDIETVLAVADIELIERVMGNLIENALRHTPAGGHVRMEMSVAPELIRVRVIDTEVESTRSTCRESSIGSIVRQITPIAIGPASVLRS